MTESKIDQSARREKTREAARRYIENGLAAIPVPTGEKKTRRKNWHKERHTIEDVERLWTNGQNIGILLGEPSNGLTDVDLDRPEARAVAPYLLPKTRSSGRTNCPDSHRWYYCDPLPRTTSYKLPGKGDDRCVVELRSTGAQTVVYPSTHPSGDTYVWGGGDIAAANGTALGAAVEDVAAASLLLMNYPGRGARHDYVLAAAGYLGRHLEEERTQRIMEATIYASDDEETPSRLANVRNTLDRLAVGEAATGGPKLDELAPGTTDQLLRWGVIKRSPVNDGRTAATTTPPQNLPVGLELTDLGNADRFVAQQGQRVRWCYSMRSYLIWDGCRWAKDEGGVAVKLAQEVARNIHHEAASATDKDEQRRISRWAVASQSATRINAMLSQAQPHISVGVDALDNDSMLLNCRNGTVELRSGRIRAHDPTDLITKLVPVDYAEAAVAPRFEKFLKETLVDEGVIRFVQRYAGYSLTGDTRERVIAILYGSGKNGKSTLVELLLELLGDYADSTDVETMLAKRYSGVGNDVAALVGNRFVATSEIEKGRRLAESKVKQLTGRDTVTARFLFCEPFSFKPQFKLWMSTNNKPEIRGTDDAIWDRIRLVPFTKRFTGAAEDQSLPDRLREELSGVMSWAVRGCLDWQQQGLGEAEKITNATQAYREEQDTLAAFMEDRCVVHPDVWVRYSELRAAYEGWCLNNGEVPEKSRTFAALLEDRGFVRDTGTGNVKIRWGIALRSDNDPPGGDDGGSDDGPQNGNSFGEIVTDGPQNFSNESYEQGEHEPTFGNYDKKSYRSVTAQKSCKNEENVWVVTDSYRKNHNFHPIQPHVETFWKNGNYGNSVT